MSNVNKNNFLLPILIIFREPPADVKSSDLLVTLNANHRKRYVTQIKSSNTIYYKEIRTFRSIERNLSFRHSRT